MTTSKSPIAVTGSTGALGGKVASLLSDDGYSLRLLARSPERAPALPNSAVVECNFGDLDQATEALRGVEVLFMVSAAEHEDRLAQHLTFVDAAQAAGIKHIIYTSFQGAAPGALFTLARDHYATEQHIKASGMSWTMLRDSFYLDFLTAVVGEDGVIRGPAGDGRVAAVSRDDVARVAAEVLRNPKAHAVTTYDLTGPTAVSFDETAKIISKATGQRVTFHNETLAEAYESRKPWGAPDWQNDAWVSTYTAIAAGEVSAVSDAVEKITGQKPMSLEQFVAAR
ncbi:uncharacterized protein YbjT (DUF2867 family) [Microbacterium halimionae]|uniref:Uncharacterized protein YbjT (DUF2867 family) n=1 Tax=Microbacterium halimionae TaxID=1526413 RepID=A0A7W3PM96_9MICO|nr:SDR family oxidoreductase [Microbacterium halimionae]MBA8817380.1 uncharacterized protein YbjT (DUF2867 family) [Microbacterium halimionae]NII96014.1 uncharacterized protein YbjT (DUF2867 family) [Microbacterium halimionae]